MSPEELTEFLAELLAAGFIDEKGQVRKVLGRLPLTADGCVVGEDAVIHKFTCCPSRLNSLREIRPRLIEYVDHDEWNWVHVDKSYGSREAAVAAHERGDARH